MKKTISTLDEYFNDFSYALKEYGLYENKDYRVVIGDFGVDFVFENLSESLENELLQILKNIKNQHRRS